MLSFRFFLFIYMEYPRPSEGYRVLCSGHALHARESVPVSGGSANIVGL